MEFAGYDAALNRTRLDALSGGAAEYLPSRRAAVVEEWYGWRPMTYATPPMPACCRGRSQPTSSVNLVVNIGVLLLRLLGQGSSVAAKRSSST
jgi:D-amino-acid dehydrogenase